MKPVLLSVLGLLCLACVASADDKMKDMKMPEKASGPDWNMTATAIEACSCPMFCQCYFSTAPAGHHHGDAAAAGGAEDHYCKFNNAYMVSKGKYGNVKLDGAKFWIYGDLGGDFSQGHMDWAVVTFDKATTKEQRDAIAAICGHLFPVHWNSLTTAEGDIEWKHPSSDEAYATLDGGKTAEVRLSAASLNRDAKAQPMVLKNMKYWGASSNDGFVMMPNTIETLKTGDKAYEFKGTNGFMITINIDSKTAPPAMTGM